VDGGLVSESDDSQIATLQLGNRGPESKSISFLLLDTNRRLDNASAHFFREIGTLLEYLILEIGREFVVGHDFQLTSRAQRTLYI
jgi:hypothetical protein